MLNRLLRQWFSPTRGLTSELRRQRLAPRKLNHRRRPQFELLEDRVVPSAAVWTNLPDYLPGQTAIIGGSGFAAGETVDMQVLNDSASPPTLAGNPPAWTVTADANGAFSTSWTCTSDLLGCNLEADASGETSGLTAVALFKDGALDVTDSTGAVHHTNFRYPGKFALYIDSAGSGQDIPEGAYYVAVIQGQNVLGQSATADLNVDANGKFTNTASGIVQLESLMDFTPIASINVYKVVLSTDTNFANSNIKDEFKLGPAGPGAPALSTTASFTGDGNVGTTYLTDTATLTSGTSPTGTIDFTLTLPDGTVIDEGTVPVNGDGTYSLGISVQAMSAGVYTWLGTYSGDGQNLGTIDDGTGESITVGKNSTILTTQASEMGNVVGTAILSDTATLADGVSPGGTISFSLKAPDGSITPEGSVAVSANGDYASPTVVATQVGIYTWSASYSGDANNNSSHDDGTNESLTVIPTGPGISANAGEVGSVEGSAVLTDTAHLTGTTANAGGTITFTLTGPSGAVTLPAEDATMTVNGPGDYTTPTGITATEEGNYVWTASYSGDSLNNPASEPATPTELANETSTVVDAKPTVTVTSSPSSPSEDSTATASGTISDYDDSITSVTASGGGSVTLYDNTSWSWSESPNLGDAAQTITITVINADGSTGTTSFTFTPTDVAPTVTGTSSVGGVEGATVMNSGTYADYDDAVSVSGTGVTDNKDGTWSWSGKAPDEDSTGYDVTVTATNADTTTSTFTFHVSGTDAAPTVTGTTPVSGIEGTTVLNSGSYADFDDAVSVAGTGVTDNGNGTWSWSGTAPDEDSAGYDVTVTATNADSSTGTFMFHVSGTDAAPTISASDLHLCEGDAGSRTATVSDYDDTVTVTKTSGPGSVTAAGVWSTTGLADGTYTVNLLATNADGSTATTSFMVSVGNETPTVSTVTVAPSGTITVGSTAVSVSGAWSDPGNGLTPAETYTGSVDWGDSHSDTITVNANGTYSSPTHIYTSVGNFTITVAINDGGTDDPSCTPGSSKTAGVTVSKAVPKIVTAASSAITLGTTAPTISDSITMSNSYSATGSMSVTLMLGATTVKTDTITAGNKSVTESYTLPTNATVAGTYQWVVSYAGDSNNTSAADQGGTAEQTVVSKAQPTVTTAAAFANSAAGNNVVNIAVLEDKATLAGGYYETGTITFKLFAPGVNTSTGTPVYTETDTVSGNAVITTHNTLVATQTGTYTWTAVYNGDGNNKTAADQGGAAEQLATIALHKTGLARTMGYWGSTQAVTPLTTIWNGNGGAAFANLLTSYDFRNADGTIHTFVNTSATKFISDLQSWMNNISATNMSNQLSAQMLAMLLNTKAGYVSATAYVYVGGISLNQYLNPSSPGLVNVNGFVKISDLINATIKELQRSGTAKQVVLSGDPYRNFEEALKNVFDSANSDKSIYV